MNDSLVSITSMISSMLLVPTMLLLVGGFLGTVLLFGGFLAEWRQRRKIEPEFRTALNRQRDGGGVIESWPAAAPLVAAFLKRGEKSADEKCLTDLELESRRRLSLLMLGVRIGPVLGLAGTLIPLGPALVALSSGDTQTLANRLVVAFSTSVLGLFVSGCCYLMHSCRKLWYSQDLSDAAFLVEARSGANS